MGKLRWTIAWFLGLVASGLIVGCSGGSTSVAAPEPDASMAASDAGGAAATLGVWDLTLDRDTLTGELLPIVSRGVTAQADGFLLPLNQFMRPDTIALRDITQNATTVHVTYRVTHPFAAPIDPGALATATNRADLGFAGVVLFLADVENASGHTFFDNVVVNTSMVTNADAYWQPGSMLATPASRLANCFPGLNVVDEAGTGNRVGLSNGGSPFGNFGANGWTRSDLGPAPHTGWTGYGILHQGQAADRTVDIALAEWPGASGFLSLQLALIAKYTDPRGGMTASERQAHRLPDKPLDHTTFAYRMPYGALDLASCQIESNSVMQLNRQQPGEVYVRLLDWDLEATESPKATLVGEADLRAVPGGFAAAPTLELNVPRLGRIFHAAQTSIGNPWHSFTFTVNAASLSATYSGAVPGLIRCTDPEALLEDGGAQVLDKTLQPVTSARFDVRAFQAVTFSASSIAGWASRMTPIDLQSESLQVTELLVDAAGNSYVQGTMSAPYDFNPGQADGDIAGVFDAPFLARYRSDGAFQWAVSWENDLRFGAAQLSQAGAVVYIPFNLHGSAPTDLDPGAGMEIRTRDEYGAGFITLNANNGLFQLARGWPVSYLVPLGLAVREDSSVIAAVSLNAGDNDLDPTPTQQLVDVPGGTLGVLQLDGTGHYQAHTLLTRVEGVFSGLSCTQMGADRTGRVTLVGNFIGKVDFDPGPEVLPLRAGGSGSLYLMSLNADLSLSWAQHWVLTRLYTSNGDRGLRDFAVADDGSVYLTARTPSFINASPGWGGGPEFSGHGQYLTLLLAMGPQGQFRWAQAWGEDVVPQIGVVPIGDAVLASIVHAGSPDLDFANYFHEWRPPTAGVLSSSLALYDHTTGTLLASRSLGREGVTALSSRAMTQVALSPADQTLRWAGTHTNSALDLDPLRAGAEVEYALGGTGVVARLQPNAAW